jgi:hypothetical protein
LLGGIAAIVNFYHVLFLACGLAFQCQYIWLFLGMITTFFLKKQYVFSEGKQPDLYFIGFFILVNIIGFL